MNELTLIGTTMHSIKINQALAAHITTCSAPIIQSIMLKNSADAGGGGLHPPPPPLYPSLLSCICSDTIFTANSGFSINFCSDACRNYFDWSKVDDFGQ